MSRLEAPLTPTPVAESNSDRQVAFNFIYRTHALERRRYVQGVNELAAEMREIFSRDAQNVLWFEVADIGNFLQRYYDLIVNVSQGTVSQTLGAAYHVIVNQGRGRNSVALVEESILRGSDSLKHVKARLGDDNESQAVRFSIAQAEAADILISEGYNIKVLFEQSDEEVVDNEAVSYADIWSEVDFEKAFGMYKGIPLHEYQEMKPRDVRLLRQLEELSENVESGTIVLVVIGGGHQYFFEDIFKKLGNVRLAKLEAGEYGFYEVAFRSYIEVDAIHQNDGVSPSDAYWAKRFLDFIEYVKGLTKTGQSS